MQTLDLLLNYLVVIDGDNTAYVLIPRTVVRRDEEPPVFAFYVTRRLPFKLVVLAKKLHTLGFVKVLE